MLRTASPGRRVATAEPARRQVSARLSVVLTLLVPVLGLSIVTAVGLGASSVSFIQAWDVIINQLAFWQDGTDSLGATGKIAWLVRMPRVLLAALVGAGLAVSGVALQALVRNPLAEPYLLGISSGATTGVAAVMVLGFFSGAAFAVSLGAFAGAIVAVACVFAVASVGGQPVPLRLILSGVALGGVFSSMTSFIVLIEGDDSEAARSIMFWTLGSLASAQWSQLGIPAAVVALSIIFLASRARALNALVAGDEQALAVGISVSTMRVQVIVVASLLTGTLVAVSGAIGFVGLMIPHLVRMVTGADHRIVLPTSALSGAIFLVWVDVAARLTLAPTELPLGIVTSVLGAPVFVYLMRRHARRGTA